MNPEVTGRGQPAAGQPAGHGLRGLQEHGPVRGGQARRPARHQGPAAARHGRRPDRAGLAAGRRRQPARRRPPASTAPAPPGSGRARGRPARRCPPGPAPMDGPGLDRRPPGREAAGQVDVVRPGAGGRPPPGGHGRPPRPPVVRRDRRLSPSRLAGHRPAAPLPPPPPPASPRPNRPRPAVRTLAIALQPVLRGQLAVA